MVITLFMFDIYSPTKINRRVGCVTDCCFHCVCYTLLQLFNEINSRDIEKINIFRGMFDSWVFIIVMVCTVAFQVIIVELLGTFASTVPLSWQLWACSLLIGAVSMPVAAVVKCIPVETHSFKHPDGYVALPTGPQPA